MRPSTVAELERFPEEGAIWLSVESIRKLSPDSHSIVEFLTPLDANILTKISKQPLLGEQIVGSWNIRLGRELHMTDDSPMFKPAPSDSRLPLFEGKMIHQFKVDHADPKYWLEESESRRRLLPRDEEDTGQELWYQSPRLAFREIARNTDARTVIAAILPPTVLANHKLTLVSISGSNNVPELSAYLLGVWNSFVFDFVARQRVTTNVSMFTIHQLPLPRLPVFDVNVQKIVRRAARLTCTTPAYDRYVKVFGLRDHSDGTTDPAERARLRAELDGLVAHLYGLTEDEFSHILASFPLVTEPVKQAARNAYRDVERGLIH